MKHLTMPQDEDRPIKHKSWTIAAILIFVSLVGIILYYSLSKSEKITCEIINDELAVSSIVVCNQGCYLRLSVTREQLENLEPDKKGNYIIKLANTKSDPDYEIKLDADHIAELLEIFAAHPDCHSVNLVKELDSNEFYADEVPEGEYCVVFLFDRSSIQFLLNNIDQETHKTYPFYRTLAPGSGHVAELDIPEEELMVAMAALEFTDFSYAPIMLSIIPHDSGII